MRDLVVRESLEALARAAAERLGEFVRSGEEVPFELSGPEEGSPFAQYTPMSGRFVREHAAELSDLEAFAQACEAIRDASVAVPYLERFSVPVPDSEEPRAAAAAMVFLSRLWEGSSDFTLEGERLPAALGELEGAADAGAPDGEAEIVAPLIGFHMPTTRLGLENVTLIRADVVEVPDEVRRTEGTRRGAWEPQFLAVVRGPGPTADPPEPAPAAEGLAPGAALRELVRTLRLFKAGGVALGPHAWARAPGDRWRRLVTGAAQPRPGGYRLTDSDLADLAAFSRALAKRGPIEGVLPAGSGAAGTFARALSRFEVGLERPALLEALSDYVLTLRCLLDGGGADVGLEMRVAALCAEPRERPGVKAEVERGLALERSLMRGELPHTQDTTPLELVAELEERVRALLRDVASGTRGVDLRAAADEELLADGISAGEGAAEMRGATAEWGAVEPAPPASNDPDSSEAQGTMQEIEAERETRLLMADRNHDPSRPPEVEPEVIEHRGSGERRHEGDDWLSEVDARGETLDWPERPEALKLLDRRPAERDRARRRVRHLFPRPETTEWGVAELQYDRRRKRARV